MAEKCDKYVRPIKDADQCTTGYLLCNFGDWTAMKLHSCHEKLLYDRVHWILANYRGNRVLLIGRSNEKPTIGVNRTISAERIKLVVKFIVGKGKIDRTQIETRFDATNFSDDPKAPENRSVQVVFKPPQTCMLSLPQDKSRLRAAPKQAMIKRCRDVLTPIAKQAGRSFRIVPGAEAAELHVHFQHKRPETGCQVAAVMGVASTPGVANADTARHTFSSIRDQKSGKCLRLFGLDDAALGGYIGNTVVHELGHAMANLDDIYDDARAENYMHNTSQALLKKLGTPEKVRNHYSEAKQFTVDQVRRLVCAIKTGDYTPIKTEMIEEKTQ